MIRDETEKAEMTEQLYEINFVIESARLNEGKIELLAAYHGRKCWLWSSNFQASLEQYCTASGKTIQQAVDELNQEITGPK